MKTDVDTDSIIMTKKDEKGVRFLVEKQQGTEVQNFMAISERIALLKVKI